MASDSDIRFYMGLPDYATFIALYSVSAKPRHCRNPALHREGPQKNRERANLAFYFYKAACRLNPGIVF